MSITELVVLTGESFELVSKLYIRFQREYMDVHSLTDHKCLPTFETDLYAFNSVYNLLR